MAIYSKSRHVDRARRVLPEPPIYLMRFVPLFLGQFKRAPEIPARRCAIRFPLHAELGQRLGRRQAALAESNRITFAHAIVIHRQDIGTAQPKHEQHFHCPAADAPYLHEPLNDGSSMPWISLSVGIAPSRLLRARSFNASTLALD